MSTTGLSATVAVFRSRRATDDSVLTDALAGDPVAFSEFYRRYHTRIQGYCLARLRDAAAADDATQEVFLRVLRAEDSGVRSPKAWLFTIAGNVIADTYRRTASRPAETASGDVLTHDISTGRDSAAEVIDRETARNVFTAIRRLVPKQRTALILRELHGQSSADIAEALDTTVGNTDVLISRARDAFGDAYADVSELSRPCREAVAAIYREGGSGISPAEKVALGAHLDTCPRCTAEFRRAHSKRYLPSLVPFLVPDAVQADFLARASVWLQRLPESVLVRVADLTPGLSMPMKLGTAAVLTAVAATSLTGVVRSATPQSTPPPLTATLAPARPTPRITSDRSEVEGTHATQDSWHSTPDTHVLRDTHAEKLPDWTHTSTMLPDGTHTSGTHVGDTRTSTSGTGATTDSHTMTPDGGTHVPGTPGEIHR